MRLAWLFVLLAARTSFGAEPSTLTEGPWGRVEIVPMRVRLPVALVPDNPLPMQPWIFHGGQSEIRSVLLQTGVPETLAGQLLATYAEAEGGLLRPGAALLRELPADARSRLYDVLRRVPGNNAQQSPHTFSRERIAYRFRHLKPETLQLVEAFLYDRPSAPASRLLSDLPALTRLVEDDGERVRLVQAVSEQESVMLRLRLDESSDAASLAAYWGRGGRRRDLEILITSLKDFESGYDLDVLYLLPSFARSFLFTYPNADKAAKRDCFWTSLNFFLPTPDDSLDGPALKRMMDESYRRVEGPLQLGDVLVLWKPSGDAVHSAVYIAGDVYLTKNGGYMSIPWLFMRLSDILDRYDDAVTRPLVHFRRKDLID
jgi:hypothetical protein